MDQLSESDNNGESPDAKSRSRYEGYSDHKSVSTSILKSVDDAVDSFTGISAAHQAGRTVKPDEAAYARSNIEAAALKLIPELRHEAPDDADEIDDADELREKYAEILSRWQDGSDQTENGFIHEIREISLVEGVPGWVHQFVIDIRVAAWNLGYTKAGRHRTENIGSDIEADARSMFE